MLGLIGAFFLQEPLVAAVAIGYAVSNGISSLTIHLLYVSLTLFDIFAGYAIGSWVFKNHGDRKLFVFLKKQAHIFFPPARPIERRILFFLMNPTIFPLTPFLLPFLNFSFVEAVILMMLSNILLWYIGVWGLVSGYMSESGFSYMHGLMVLPLLLAFLWRFFRKDTHST
ncbi:MAG: hypothetical protein WAX38_05005 [Minisyncoccia bacterium]